MLCCNPATATSFIKQSACMAKAVSCRSLAATELLAKAGYSQLAWINGGFETSKQQELQVRALMPC